MKRNKRNTNSKDFQRAKFDSNSRKSNSRNSNPDNDTDRSNRVPRTNDSSWYTRNPDLVKATARIPFPNRPGMALDLRGQFVNSGIDAGTYPASIPGIMSIKWVPTVGVSDNNTSPISLAGRDIFSRVRSAFSGSINADGPDFIMHIMAMDSFYTYCAFLKRVYRILNTFTTQNLMTPDNVLAAMGFSADMIAILMGNRMELYGRICELFKMAEAMYVPDIFPVLHRHVWMSERIYTDAPTLNSQMYIFVPEGLYKFKTDSEGAGMLTYQELNIAGFTSINAMFEYGRKLLDDYMAWDDAFIINGYLARAYESDRSFSIDPPQIGDVCELVYNETVLGQIENIKSIPTPGTKPNITITQDVLTNAIISNPSFTVRSTESAWHPYTEVDTLISCRQDEPTEIDVIENTRFVTLLTPVLANGNLDSYLVTNCGTEIVSNIQVFYPGLPNDTVDVNQIYIDMTNSTGAYTNAAYGVLATTALSWFDWHPILPIVTAWNVKDELSLLMSYCGDMHNVTTIKPSDMAGINRCCLYSEFNSFIG